MSPILSHTKHGFWVSPTCLQSRWDREHDQEIQNEAYLDNASQTAYRMGNGKNTIMIPGANHSTIQKGDQAVLFKGMLLNHVAGKHVKWLSR